MATPTDALKEKNTTLLAGGLLVNFAIFLFLLNSNQIFSGDIQNLAKNAATLIPATLAALLIGVVNGLLTPNFKARLVFWRWSNPLPGARAFSKYIWLDDRINTDALKNKIGTFPIAPRDQNALWYSMFKSVEASSAGLGSRSTLVRSSHPD